MLTSRFRFGVGLTAIAFAALAFANVVDAITLKRTATVDQKITYKSSGTIDAGGQTMTLEMNGLEHVTAVDKDGNISLEESQSDLQVNGTVVPDQGGVVKMTAKPSGEITSFEAPAEGGGIRMSNIQAFYYPTDPVKVGDKWTASIKQDAKLNAVPLTASFTVVGEEKIGDWDTLKIEGTIKETEGTTPASATSTYWIGKQDGVIDKEVSELKDIPFGGMTFSGKFTTTRVK
jgi:hypothetical protein